MSLTDMELWEKAASFHGHICPGLTIGYKAALYARELLGLEFSEDEETVCVTENDACGVDAISVILGCSIGKGNLLFRMRGKQAFSFFNRKTGKGVRLVLKSFNFSEGTRDERQKAIFAAPFDELFSVKEVPFNIPERASLFKSVACEACGESTAESHIRLQEGKKLCLDCCKSYDNRPNTHVVV